MKFIKDGIKLDTEKDILIDEKNKYFDPHYQPCQSFKLYTTKENVFYFHITEISIKNKTLDIKIVSMDEVKKWYSDNNISIEKIEKYLKKHL